MMDYSKQSRLGRFGARWGCFGTAPINVVETEIGRMLTHIELRTVLGNWVLTEKVAICNYKNHSLFKGVPEEPGWNEKVNPEHHFHVHDLEEAVKDVMWCLGVEDLTHTYDIIKWKTPQGNHYVLRIDGSVIVNPDPSIGSGPVEEVIPIML